MKEITINTTIYFGNGVATEGRADSMMDVIEGRENGNI
jgi:hypothetical protein